MSRVLLIVVFILAVLLVRGTPAVAGPWSQDTGSAGEAVADIMGSNCQTRLGSTPYSCKLTSSSGTSFTDTFTFTSPGVLSAHFDLAVSGIPGATFGCACAPSGTFLNPVFNDSFFFQCVGPFGSGQITFQGEIKDTGVIKHGTALSDAGDTFVFKCKP
jgi:hypothetical protein